MWTVAGLLLLVLLAPAGSIAAQNITTIRSGAAQPPATATATALDIFKLCIDQYEAAPDSKLKNTNITVTFKGSSTQFTQLKTRNAQLRNSNRETLAFVEPSSTADMSAAVKCSNVAGLKFVASSGGHSYEANSLIDGGVVMDTYKLQEMTIDTSTETVTLGAGQRLGPIYAALAAKGYVLPGGTCAGVGVSGLTLGGGIGHSTRALGVLDDSVLGATVVLADGSVVQATGNENSDLFWAIRGGGPLYGIVTSWVFQLHQAPGTVSVVRYSHSEGCTESACASAVAAFNAWKPWELSQQHAMAEIQCGFGALHAQLWYWGPLTAAESTVAVSPVFQLKGFKPQMQQEFGWPEFVIHMTNLQESKTWGSNDLTVSAVVKKDAEQRSSFSAASLLPTQPLSPSVISTLASWMAKAPKNAFIQTRALRGAVGAVSNNYNVFPWRDAIFENQVYSSNGDATQDKQWVEGVLAAMQPLVGYAEFYNYYHCVDDPWASYFGPHADRLRSIKAKYDPLDKLSGLYCQA